jgi:putative ABC transport system permease protein
MKLACYLAWKSSASRPARSATTVFGVAVGVTIVVAVLTVDHNTLLEYAARAHWNYAAPQIEVIGESFAPGDIDPNLPVLRDTPGVAVATPVIIRSMNIQAANGEHLQSLVCAIDFDQLDRFEVFQRESGQRWTDGLWVTESLALRLGTDAGGAVLLGGRRFPLEGRLRNQWLARASPQALAALLPLEVGRSLLPDPTGVPLYWIALRPGADADVVRARLARQFAVRPSRNEAEASLEGRVMRMGFKTMGLMSLSLGVFLIFHIMLMSLAERTHEIGLMHAIGTTRNQIAAALLAEAALLASTGAAIGWGAGLAASVVMSHMRLSSMGMTPYRIESVPIGLTLAVAGLGVLATLIGAAYPIWKSRHVSTTLALRPRGLGETRRPLPRLGWVGFACVGALLVPLHVWAGSWNDPGLVLVVQTVTRILGVLLVCTWALFALPGIIRSASLLVGRAAQAPFGHEGLLSFQRMSRAGESMTVGIAGIMVVVACFFSMKALTGSMKAEIDDWARIALSDVMFVYRDDGNPALADQVAQVPEVTSVLAVHNEVSAPFLIRAIDLSGLPPGMVQDPSALQRYALGQGTFLSRTLARQLGVNAGATVRVATRTGLVAVEVLDVTDAFGFIPSERAYALMTPAFVERQFGAPARQPQVYAVHLLPGTDQDAVRTRIERLLSYRPRGALRDAPLRWWHPRDRRTLLARRYSIFVPVLPGDTMHANRLRNVDWDFMVFDAMLLLTLAMAGVGVFSSLLVSGIERQKEIGLFRALGMTRPQLARMLSAEGFIVGINGGVLGILMGVPFAAVALAGLRALSGLQLPFHVPWVWGLALLPLATAVGLVAARYPARLVARTSTAEILRYE